MPVWTLACLSLTLTCWFTYRYITFDFCLLRGKGAGTIRLLSKEWPWQLHFAQDYNLCTTIFNCSSSILPWFGICSQAIASAEVSWLLSYAHFVWWLCSLQCWWTKGYIYRYQYIMVAILDWPSIYSGPITCKWSLTWSSTCTIFIIT